MEKSVGTGIETPSIERRMTRSKVAIAALAGFVGGNVASFVKWGTEVPFPPRTPDRALPPAEMLQSLGLNPSAFTYHYSEHTLNFAVSLIHHGFSIVFAMLYCLLAERYPRITLWQGLAFGLFVTVAFHGVLLPLFAWAPPLWRLPYEELLSETFGHLLWIWVIEVFRRDLVYRWNTQSPFVTQP